MLNPKMTKTASIKRAEVISIYTRQSAIADGVLVDMTLGQFGKLAEQAGIKWPIAMTVEAFQEFVAVSDSPAHVSQDLKGRWWDVVYMMRRTKREVSAIEWRWKLNVRDPDGKLRLKEIKGFSGPDDNGEPCLTFMMPYED